MRRATSTGTCLRGGISMWEEIVEQGADARLLSVKPIVLAQLPSLKTKGRHYLGTIARQLLG